jgi:hypothetical protein
MLVILFLFHARVLLNIVRSEAMNTCQITWCQNPADRNLNIFICYNIKMFPSLKYQSHIYVYFPVETNKVVGTESCGCSS